MRTAIIITCAAAVMLTGVAGAQSARGRFARLVPRARIVLLPNANHFVFRSNEGEVLSAMRAFIDTLPR